MANMQLDALDYFILKTLSEDARKPYLEIARECGVSGAAIHQRIQKLTHNGVIVGSQTLITPSSVGYGTCAYIGFCLADPFRFDEVVEQLRQVPEVVELHFTTGKYDLFIKVYAKNNPDLLNIIHTKLQNIGFGRTETIVSFKEEFRRQVPIIQD
ncbi:MAG: Lrp/AsnC ligand binding domain-containing protein [Muribaculaceae bacterium]|nr:Lrp/AsnC ligand binding domain-containing protein [Muribaculaceae bacterium]